MNENIFSYSHNRYIDFNVYKVVKNAKNGNSTIIEMHNIFYPIGAIIMIPNFEETVIYQENKDCFELYEIKSPFEEKQSEKKPQFTEEQAVKLFIDAGYGISRNGNTIELLKQKGYIIKSPVEEAEEMYKRWLKVDDLHEKQHEAIEHLKKNK